jgi:hypothetical protein
MHTVSSLHMGQRDREGEPSLHLRFPLDPPPQIIHTPTTFGTIGHQPCSSSSFAAAGAYCIVSIVICRCPGKGNVGLETHPYRRASAVGGLISQRHARRNIFDDSPSGNIDVDRNNTVTSSDNRVGVVVVSTSEFVSRHFLSSTHKLTRWHKNPSR